jgi:hypothetical protein
MIPNIIVLSYNPYNYKGGNYHQDLLNALKKVGNTFIYGPGIPKGQNKSIDFPDYNINDNILDVVDKSPWNIESIDYIIATTLWDKPGQNKNNKIVDPHPNINLSDILIKKIFFLNKEYINLNEKIDYINTNQFNLVLTVLPEKTYKNWSINKNIIIEQSHFGINLDLFKPLNIYRKYDLSFTGSLHKQYTNKRIKVKHELFKFKYQVTNQGILKYLVLFNPLNKKYIKYNIYWAEWSRLSIDIFGKSLLPSGIKYVQLMNESKVFLCTLSADGILGTRFFELMACKTLIICPTDDYYGILIDDFNCVMYKNDLSDFEYKLDQVISNEAYRNKLINNAFYTSQKQTYDYRMLNIFSKL